MGDAADQVDEGEVLGAKFVVELLGNALNIERFAKSFGDFDHGYVAGWIKFADLEDQGAEFAQKQIAGLVDLEIVIPRVGFAVIPFDPVPQALVSAPVDEDQEIFMVQPCNL